MSIRQRLQEGCHEENKPDRCIFNRETSTKWGLARVMTKSKSKMQTVTNGCVSQKWMNMVSSKHPDIGDLIE